MWLPVPSTSQWLLTAPRAADAHTPSSPSLLAEQLPQDKEPSPSRSVEKDYCLPHPPEHLGQLHDAPKKLLGLQEQKEVLFICTPHLRRHLWGHPETLLPTLHLPSPRALPWAPQRLQGPAHTALQKTHIPSPAKCKASSGPQTPALQLTSTPSAFLLLAHWSATLAGLCEVMGSKHSGQGCTL